ncbi:MAG: hypothetical protein ACRDHL_00360 [Candidatus Promineifilaceae bacterium]
MPTDSGFYNRALPTLLILLGVVTVVLILFALAVLLRLIPS